MVHTILVIDNETTQTDLICAMLEEKLGYKAIKMASENEAANYVITQQLPKPDLILINVVGLRNIPETIMSLRNSTAPIPIIALAQYGDYASAVAAMDAGAQDFLSKPVALERMSATLHNALLLRDARREAEWLRLKRINEAEAAGSVLPNVHPHNFSLMGDDGHVRRIQEIEINAIRFAMHHYNSRMTEVARRLGIGRSTLYRKLNELSVRDESTVVAA